MRQDYKNDWSGNAVREALISAGIPSPNNKLINALAPVIAKTAKGETLRRWKHSTAEMQPLLLEMKPLIQRIEAHKHGNDPELLSALLKEASDFFYTKLEQLETKKSSN